MIRYCSLYFEIGVKSAILRLVNENVSYKYAVAEKNQKSLSLIAKQPLTYSNLIQV